VPVGVARALVDGVAQVQQADVLEDRVRRRFVARAVVKDEAL
jgi:hypothetical protein